MGILFLYSFSNYLKYIPEFLEIPSKSSIFMRKDERNKNEKNLKLLYFLEREYVFFILQFTNYVSLNNEDSKISNNIQVIFIRQLIMYLDHSGRSSKYKNMKRDSLLSRNL